MDSSDSDVCGATTNDGSACQRPAGWGTEHVGEGRCKTHGGKGGRPADHGRYAAKRSESLQEKIRQFREEENPAEMWEELALLRAVLQEWLADLETLDEDTIGVILDLQNSIRRTLDSINKIQTRTALTAAEVDYLQARIADLFETYVPPEKRREALDELKRLTDSNNTPSSDHGGFRTN